MRGVRRISRLALVVCGSFLFQSCQVDIGGAFTGFFSDCFSEDSISESKYDDLNPLEQILYEENDCGRYEPRNSLIGDIID